MVMLRSCIGSFVRMALIVGALGLLMVVAPWALYEIARWSVFALFITLVLIVVAFWVAVVSGWVRDVVVPFLRR